MKYTKKQRAAMRLCENDLVELLMSLVENRTEDVKQALADTKDSVSILVDAFKGTNDGRDTLSNVRS